MLFLEEIWSRNFTNLFIAPMKISEKSENNMKLSDNKMKLSEHKMKLSENNGK